MNETEVPPAQEENENETSHSHRQNRGAADSLFVRLVDRDDVSSFPLPADGEMTLGRAGDADLRVTLPGISRRHAILRLGTRVSLCDLGSSNGTMVRGEKLAPQTWAPIRIGEVFALADVAAVVLQGKPSDRARSALSPTVFTHVIQSALVAFNKRPMPFGVITFRSNNAPRWIDALANLVTRNDTVALFDETDVGVLLVNRKLEDLEVISHSIERYFRDRGGLERFRLAICPRDGRHESELFHVTPIATSHKTDRPHEHIARSPKMVQLYELVDSIADSPTSILILGETGVGKEVLARAIHERSGRRSAPFVGINCAALPENLLESELFGYEKGAFTGAVSSKLGLFEAAAGGTVFLDEVGEMPLPTQAKMLRVLQERTVLPLGGLKPRPIDVRILSATNRHLKTEIEARRFRADLFYRLNGLSLTIPPLRERTEEIAPLVEHFAAAAPLGKRSPTFAPEVIRQFETYEWPGNVRELRSVVERALLLCRSGVVTLEHLPEEIFDSNFKELEAPTGGLPFGVPSVTTEMTIPLSAIPGPPSSTRMPSSPNLRNELEDLERERIQRALLEHGGNQTRAAQALGITRRVLIGRMERYNLPRPRTERSPTK